MTPTTSSSHPGRLPLEHLLRDEDYTFRLRLVKADPATYFRPWDTSGQLLRERHRWLTQAPDRHAPLLPESTACIDEWAELAPTFLLPASDLTAPVETPRSDTPPPNSSHPQATPPQRRWIELASRIEPDLVLLERSDAGPRMVAGAVAFPSSWAPEEKLRRSLREIHEPVPDLNRALAASIDAFLSRLSPGFAWLRANWGLTASTELNQHPARGLPRLSSASRLEDTFLRVEHQALMALPKTGGWAFGIRVEQLPLDALAQQLSLAQALIRALESMPEAMARYKGLTDARATLLAQLRTLG